jgi:hypothetical protein
MSDLKLSVKKGAASSSDKDLGSNAHFNIHFTSLDQAHRALRILRENLTDVVMADVRRSLLDSIRNGHIKIEDMTDKLLGNLLKEKHIPIPQ